MSLRAPHERIERKRILLPADLDLDRLAAAIRAADGPIPLEDLARQALRTAIVEDSQLQVYAAGRSYRRGERIRLLDGRVGDVIGVERGENPVQGPFKVAVLRLHSGGIVRLATEVLDGPTEPVPELVSDDAVDHLLASREAKVVGELRQALASDPRFVTLYDSDGEYAALREFFPPMSPDVLDAALALLLDALFDQVPISRLTGEQTAEPGAPALSPIPNETLFVPTHLDKTLGTHSEWEEPARQAFETVRSLWLRAQQRVATSNKPPTSQAFVQPVLRALGWSGVPLPDASVSEGLYALCADEMASAELYVRYDPEETFAPWVLALAQLTGWKEPLDRPTDPGSSQRLPALEELVPSSSVPSHRMVRDLKRMAVRWGILTNGPVWRLFSQDANSLSRVFYEIDLGDVFEGLTPGELPDSRRWDLFRRWWLLFRKSSYVVDSQGDCLLRRLRESFPQGERKVQLMLADRLLNSALPAMIDGFMVYRCQRLGILEESAASLRDMQQAAVLLLVRLLFLLAAEAHRLLPLDDPDYRAHSLTAQARWATSRIRRALSLNDSIYTTPHYDLVLSLMHRVSKGDPEKGLPCYGRLFFDPAEREAHAFLEQIKLSDRSIALVLDALTYGIDYETLDARDLTSACASLLGSRLSVSDAEAGSMAVARITEPAEQVTVVPDYVVTSSVQQALAPVLQARSDDFAAAMAHVVALRQQLGRALDRRKRAGLYADWEAAARMARDAFLGLRICDPAMGAGGFLLGAVDVLTDGIIDRLEAYHQAHSDVPRHWNPIYHLIDEMRQDIRDELKRQRIDFDVRRLDDATLLSRLVAQRCLFGVAQHPLAVELVKTGLWFHTFVPGAPLSFLDHHVRSGNALLGADVADIAARLGMEHLADAVVAAVLPLYPLTERVDTTPLDVRWSAGQFEKLREGVTPYRLLLDLAVSADLGDGEAEAALSRVTPGPWVALLDEMVPPWITTQAEAEGFFHWELAFPELFVDLASGEWSDFPGVDVVLGNPPWVVASDEALSQFYTARYGESQEAAYNVHHAFLSLARRLVRASSGRTSYVLSREWLADPAGGI